MVDPGRFDMIVIGLICQFYGNTMGMYNNNAKINSYNKKAQSEDQGITPKGF
jgi:hypothetical protein